MWWVLVVLAVYILGRLLLDRDPKERSLKMSKKKRRKYNTEQITELRLRLVGRNTDKATWWVIKEYEEDGQISVATRVVGGHSSSHLEEEVDHLARRLLQICRKEE